MTRDDPVSLEDLRLVELTEADGSIGYRGTYTAFSGTEVRQGLVHTEDFRRFEMRGVEAPLYGGFAVQVAQLQGVFAKAQ